MPLASAGMRFDGRLKTWNDERGFGFIEPLKGGEDIFVHIRAFAARGGRPEVGQLLSFEGEAGPQGKKRAMRVEAARRAVVRPRRAAAPGAWRTPESTLHLLALCGGWPGALLAQQLLRHKSAKAEFRTAIWATVGLNALGLIVLCSPIGRGLWDASAALTAAACRTRGIAGRHVGLCAVRWAQ